MIDLSLHYEVGIMVVGVGHGAKDGNAQAMMIGRIFCFFEVGHDAAHFVPANNGVFNLFDGFNIFEAYYAGMEPGRITRIALKLIYFFLTLFIAKIFMEAYLAFIN